MDLVAICNFLNDLYGILFAVSSSWSKLSFIESVLLLNFFSIFFRRFFKSFILWEHSLTLKKLFLILFVVNSIFINFSSFSLSDILCSTKSMISFKALISHISALFN